MRQSTLLCAIALSFLAFSSHVDARLAPEQQLKKLGDEYFERGLALNPLSGSFLLGEARFEDKLAIDIAPAHIARDKALQKWALNQTAAIDVSELAVKDQLTLTLLRHQAQTRLDGHAFPGYLMPIDQYGGLPVLLAQFATGQSVQPLKTVRNYQNFLKRLEAIPAWNAQAIANMRSGITKGVVLPRPIIERAIETMRPLAVSGVTKHPYYVPVHQFPAHFTAAQKAQLTQAYTRAIRDRLQPSLSGLVNFMQQEYLNNGRSSAGISALPDGDKWYAYAVRLHTTTDTTPEEVHQLGLAEVARIRSAMERIKSQVKFDGTLTEFLKVYPNLPQFRPFITDQEVLDAFEAINQKVKLALPALFSTTPNAKLVIRAEPELTKATASAHYESPTPDGLRPGTFYAVIMDPKEYSTGEMTSLLLHEGQPGHHFHIAGQQELPLPNFRKYDWITAYGEGWALYAETLGHEMGLYEDSDALLGHLNLELLRAVRLVTDTGLHAKGWTREKTIHYMMDVQGLTEMEARRATERYMADPGQALAYKIGALKIRALRDRAQSALGPKFSYAEFHNQVLADGALPLSLLEAKVEQWIHQQLR
jgi:uncharacterized protein (DUF885 family)